MQPNGSRVLDLILPGRDGLLVLGDLRRRGESAPVLILTARDAIDDRVRGLDEVADDSFDLGGSDLDLGAIEALPAADLETEPLGGPAAATAPAAPPTTAFQVERGFSHTV